MSLRSIVQILAQGPERLDIHEQLIPIIEKTWKLNPYRQAENTPVPKGGDTEGEKRSAMMWEEQVTLNFPLLYLASWYVYQYAKERGIKTLLFATRDCCHWVKIFQKMFPDMTAHYFHCSRNLFEKVTEMSRRERHRKSPRPLKGESENV